MLPAIFGGPGRMAACVERRPRPFTGCHQRFTLVGLDIPRNCRLAPVAPEGIALFYTPCSCHVPLPHTEARRWVSQSAILYRGKDRSEERRVGKKCVHTGES